MSKTARRIVTLLLVLLLICGIFPTAFATDAAQEDTLPTEAEPTEVVPDPTEPTLPVENQEETKATELTEPEEPIPEPPAVEDTSFEETVVATPVFLDAGSAEDIPMLMALDDGIMLAAATPVTGTHYQRAIVWLTGSEKINFTYKGKDYSVSRLYTHGVIVNGKRYVAYCIDPGVDTTQSSGGYTGSETAWSALDINTQAAVGLTILYGAPNKLSSTDKKTMLTYELATQIIVQEIILGFRNNLPPYNCTDSRIIDQMTYGSSSYFREISSQSQEYSSISGKHMDKAVLKQAYDTISASLASHYVLPSFASRYNAAAKTYEMTKQSDGSYAVTLTDTNGVLTNCSFKNGNGLTYSVSGNQLTIKASAAFDGTKSCALSGGAGVSKQVPNLEAETFMLWEAGSYQRIVSLQEPLNDPLPLYFNVKIPIQNGTAKIVKTTTNGGTVAGWHFEVKDAKGKVVGKYTTDASGVIAVELLAGTYTVTETDGSYKYWVNDPNPTRTVTVKAGETSTVTFKNQWRGQAQIVKTATNGGSVKGWHFTVKNSAGTVVGTYITNSTGIITLELEPGTYTVTETDSAYKYWLNDPQPTKTVTVKAGETATVTFQNKWRGQAQIIKTATNGGSVQGWHFTVKNSAGQVVGNYVTDASGIITLDLDPGTYTVIETDGVYEYWHNDPTPSKTITVKAGETASVTFENRWVGKAKIIKTLANPEAGSVEGWTFTIKDSSGKKVGTYQTDSKGTIVTDLEPGTYTVTEVLEEDSLWQSTTANPQTITVKAGSTAEVTFTNVLRPAKILVKKVDERGEPLTGAEFLLQWSMDGKSWSNVSYSDSTVPNAGYCTAKELADGKLISGSDGLVEFSGLYPSLHYRLTETRAPDGYQLLSAPVFTGTLSADEDLTIGFTVTNIPVFTLPETGSNSMFLSISAMVLCCVACVGVICWLRKKEV